MSKSNIQSIALAALLAAACSGETRDAATEGASMSPPGPIGSGETSPGGTVNMPSASVGGAGVAVFDSNGNSPALGSPTALVGSSAPAAGAPLAGPAGVLAPSPSAAGATGAFPVAPEPVALAPEDPGASGAGGGAAQGAGGSSAEMDDAIAEVPEPAAPVFPATNPFVDAAHDPLSTFAVDVDTASYDIFRRDVLAGFLPPAEQVRLEEFVNFFSYDYPAPGPGADEPFSIALAAAPNLIDNGTALLRVGISGELAPAFEKRPANLVFLVDVSGSMQSPEKLPLVQSVLTQALGILDPEDTVSIVTYASGTGVSLPPTKVAASATIVDVINSLSAGGSTNGAGGIQLAYEQAEAAYIEGGINHVVLATDGDFNVGVSDTAGLVQLIEQKRETGVTFTALGFGANNNDAMMELVSNAGNGMYGVIADEAQAERYVSERLLHNLVFIAKDVKIQVEFNPQHVAAYRLLGYENRAIADDDFRNDVVDAGEIGAGHRVTALYEIVLADGQVPTPDGAPGVTTGEAYEGTVEIAPEELVLVKVRHKDVDASAEDPASEVGRTLLPEDLAASHRDLDADFQWAVAVATFAEVLKGSPYVTAERLNEIADIVAEQASRDDDRAEFATLFETARGLLEAN